MAIILDIKNAIADALYEKDESVNFEFNKIQKADFPFVFFYIPSFRLEKAIDNEYWRKLTLMCVLEYQKSEDNSQDELWQFEETLSQTVKSFKFADTILSAKNIEYKTVEDVLQMTFDLEFYVKEIDETELMRELDLTLK